MIKKSITLTLMTCLLSLGLFTSASANNAEPVELISSMDMYFTYDEEMETDVVVTEVTIWNSTDERQVIYYPSVCRNQFSLTDADPLTNEEYITLDYSTKNKGCVHNIEDETLEPHAAVTYTHRFDMTLLDARPGVFWLHFKSLEISQDITIPELSWSFYHDGNVHTSLEMEDPSYLRGELVDGAWSITNNSSKDYTLELNECQPSFFATDNDTYWTVYDERWEDKDCDEDEYLEIELEPGESYTDEFHLNIQLPAGSHSMAMWVETEDYTFWAYGDDFTVDFDYPHTYFTDVTSHWGSDYIGNMFFEGVIEANEEKEFHPNQSVTADEFAAMTLTALDLDLELEGEELITREAAVTALLEGLTELETFGTLTESDNYFIDLEEHHIQGVMTSYFLDYVDGYKDEDGLPTWEFGPEDELTRAEAAKILFRVLSYAKT